MPRAHTSRCPFMEVHPHKDSRKQWMLDLAYLQVFLLHIHGISPNQAYTYVHECTACMGVGCLCVCKYIYTLYTYVHTWHMFVYEGKCLLADIYNLVRVGVGLHCLERRWRDKKCHRPSWVCWSSSLVAFLPSEQWSPTASLTCVLKCGWVWVGVAMGW